MPARVVSTFVGVALLVVTAAAARGQDRDGAASTTIRLEVRPLLDMVNWVRAESERTVSTHHERLAAARAALQRLATSSGSPLVWSLLEGPLVRCENAAEAERLLAGLPPTFTTRGGSELRLQPAAGDLGRALVDLEPWFRATIWPEHARQLASFRDLLEAHVVPGLPACYAETCAALGMTDPALTIPVYLVAEAPRPGAITHRTRGGPICVVGLNAGEDCMFDSNDLLVEVLFHETLHALDVATAGQPTALNRLRTALQAAGQAEYLRDVPHALIFVQAGEAITRHYSPDYDTYGEACRVYRRMPTVSRVVRDAWQKYLDDGLDLDATVAEIVAALEPARE